MEPNRSWLGLITLCASIALGLALGMAILGITVELAFAAARMLPDDSANGESYVGIVTDSICGAKHETDSNRTPAECTQLCVKKGAKYMLVDGDRAYTLAGDASKLSQMAGLRVRILGTLSGTTVQVNSATIAQ